MSTLGLYWFGNDLRIADNKLLQLASQEVDALLCVYCLPATDNQATLYSTRKIGPHRQAFEQQSLHALDRRLQKLGNGLYVSRLSPEKTLSLLLDEYPIRLLYRHRHPGINESRALESLQRDFPDVEFVIEDGLTLFEKSALPFNLCALPSHFSDFRHQVENMAIQAIHYPIHYLPPSLDAPAFLTVANQYAVNQTSLVEADSVFMGGEVEADSVFMGGEKAAHQQLIDYFVTDLPSHYKEVRNALDGWENSTKFSAWLAAGCLSARQVMQALKYYESRQGANDSTYWIYFELLWREYFHWYAHAHGAKLFQPKGITDKRQQGSYYAQRFRKWCQGNTPYPIVNACMKQLNQTGYMSNRGRQLVASCLIHELGVDWRYGAAYFEETLIDYDVAANWGNWQYIAGVGADPRGGRHFDLPKQTQQYDPDSTFIHKWQGQYYDQQLDSVDAADWPIYPNDSP